MHLLSRVPRVTAAVFVALLGLGFSSSSPRAAEPAWQRWFAAGNLDEFQVVSSSPTFASMAEAQIS